VAAKAQVAHHRANAARKAMRILRKRHGSAPRPFVGRQGSDHRTSLAQRGDPKLRWHTIAADVPAQNALSSFGQKRRRARDKPKSRVRRPDEQR